MKPEITCYLCFSKTKEFFDVFEDGIQLNMKSLLQQHYLFLENIEEGTSVKICACCWHVTIEFHAYYSKIKSLWDKESLNLIEIKIEMNVEPNEVSFNTSNDFYTLDQVKLESTLQALDNNIGDKNDFLASDKVSESESIESDEPTAKSKRTRSKRTTKQKLSKMQLKSNVESDQKRVKLDIEDQQIREYFKMDCDVCGDHFETFVEIKNHYKDKHQAVGYLTCCGKKFVRRGGCLSHISRHVNPDLFKCVECDKFFADSSSLQNHQDNHLPIEQRPFKCKQCPNAFAKKYMLSQHLRIAHIIDEGPFTCDDCGKSYPKKTGLKSHIKSFHELAFNVICDICAKVFKSKGILKAHRQHHFDEDMPKVQCSICGAWLKNATSLRKHINRHNSSQAKCTLCDKIAPNKSALSQHIKNVHSEAIHKCGICEKAFKKAINLKEHMALHTGEDLYTCPYCPKTFKSNANMHSHRKKGHPIEFEADREKRSKYSHE